MAGPGLPDETDPEGFLLAGTGFLLTASTLTAEGGITGEEADSEEGEDCSGLTGRRRSMVEMCYLSPFSSSLLSRHGG